MLRGPYLEPTDHELTDSVVIMLHGRGSNGNDLLPLGSHLSNLLPRTAFYSPDGIEPFEGGSFGFQWFSSGEPRGGTERFRKGSDAVNEFISEVLHSHSLPSSRCVLLGFSQGAMLSSYVGLRRKESPLAGVVVLGGMIPGLDTLSDEIENICPLCLIHGKADPVIPLERIEAAIPELVRIGITHEVHLLDGLGHSIDQRALSLVGSFLVRMLSPTEES